MFIPTITQIRELDAFTIENEPISSINLMERAAKTCSDWIKQRFLNDTRIIVVCGNGNNGGDGFAIARHLLDSNYRVSVYYYHPNSKISEDCKINFNLIKNNYSASLFELFDDDSSIKFDRDAIIIDALFGSGLNNQVDGFFAKIIHTINQTENQIISIDLPSGLFADKLTISTQNIVKASFTLTFEFPKLAFLMPENEAFIGDWTILKIGLLPDYFKSKSSTKHFTFKDDIKPIYLKRGKFSHKGSFGNALLIAGKYGMAGAAVLASKACLKSGVGLLHVHVPKEIVPIIQISAPEAIIQFDSDSMLFSDCNIENLSNFNAIAVGPGIGKDAKTASALKSLIQQHSMPMLFDADALNILSENKSWLELIPKNSIFTPHPKEFDRLTHPHTDSFSRLESLKEFSKKHMCICVLKGAHTAICLPNGDIHFNSTGNCGMATGGSGDVLTGIILALLAQSYIPANAAILGVYIHGLAADIAIKENESTESLTPSDIIYHLGKAFKFISC